MIVIDPGHKYLLDHLDGDGHTELAFVKRVGPGYEPNQAPAHEGVTIQEVVRALIHRLHYLQMQQEDESNLIAMSCLRGALLTLENRAARRAGPEQVAAFVALLDERMHVIEGEPACQKCGHVRCVRHGDKV